MHNGAGGSNDLDGTEVADIGLDGQRPPSPPPSTVLVLLAQGHWWVVLHPQNTGGMQHPPISTLSTGFTLVYPIYDNMRNY